MKNKFTTITVSLVLLFVSLGCGLSDQVQKTVGGTDNTNSNKTLSDRAVDTAVGEEKIGVAECDEVMDMLTAEANNPDDGYIVKAGKAVFFNRVKESIRKSVEQNKGDPKEIAKNCREFKAELEKFKAEESKKQ